MREILISGAMRLGITLSTEAVSYFEKYAEQLESENKKMNLTAVKGEAETAERHFVDSLAVMNVAGDKLKGSKLIDVGCGAGFPGLPLKIAEPSIKLTLLDSTEKRILFLQRLTEDLCLGNVNCVFARAEELSQQGVYRETFDFAVSRAVARLNVLSELCLPFVKVGGRFLAMKTASSIEEIEESERAIGLLGAKIKSYYDYEILGVQHRIVEIEKIAPTAEKYPRRFAKIQKQPL